MDELGRQMSSFEFDPNYEVERRDPMKMSEDYYEQAIGDLHDGFILDGLVNLQLSKDHLVGWCAPAHGRILKEHRLEKTLERLDSRITIARRHLSAYGPTLNSQETPDLSSDVGA